MLSPAPKVLISEDDPNMAHLLETYLRREGYEVAFYIGSAEGFAERVRTVRPDIVLMDIVLPSGDDGITLAERLRQEFEIPLVFITGRADEETIRRAVQTDPAGYLIKPFKLTELVATMQVAHARHRLERSLRAAREEMGQVLDTAPEARFLTDALGRLRQANGAARRLTGTDLTYHIGASLLDRLQLLHPGTGEPDPTLGDYLWRCRATPGGASGRPCWSLPRACGSASPALPNVWGRPAVVWWSCARRSPAPRVWRR